MLKNFKNLHYNTIQILPEYDQKLKIIFNAYIYIYILVITQNKLSNYLSFLLFKFLLQL